MSHLILNKLEVSRRGKTILHSITASLPSQGVIGIIGPNGAGKSTLLQTLAGLLSHQGSKILNGAWPSSDKIGFMPQHFSVKSRLSVAECILLGRREQLGWRLTSQDKHEVQRILAEFNLSHLANHRMDQLSGGQQQRVLLAQRLSRQPRLLILDEPTSALDLRYQLDIFAHLQDYCRKTNALVIISLHDLNLAGRFSNHLVMLHGGKIHQSGLPQAVLQPEQLKRVYQVNADILQSSDGNQVIIPHALAPALLKP